jgi:hypothetical protein
MEKTGRQNRMEERYYDIWVNPAIEDDYQKTHIGTRQGLDSNARILEDSASAKLVCDGTTGMKEWKNSAVQVFYLSPGITVTALYNKDKKLRRIICTGHPEDQEASKEVLEKLVGVASGINRIKLNYSHTQPI